MNVKSISRFKVLSVFLLLMSGALKAQTTEQNVIVDSTEFITYTKDDSSFTNYISPSLNAVYRKIGTKATVTLQKATSFKTIILDSSSILSRLILDSGYALLSAGDSGLLPGSLRLSPGKVEINAKETWFNGDWVKVPEHSLAELANLKMQPKGALSFNTNTKSLYISDGDTMSPAYWEYYDSADIQNPIPTKWAANYGGSNKLPVIRIRHPKNVSGFDLGNVSWERDFLIMPYEYGISVQYNGIEEHHVGEFSIHRGLNWKGLNNSDGGKVDGWGGVLWVGDDNDLGGLRATSRFDSIYGGDLKWAEVSSEKFTGKSHGPLRLRVVDSTDQIQFLQGMRGNNTQIAYLQQLADTSFLGAGQQNSLAIKTADSIRIFVNNAGMVGVNNNNPIALIDIKNNTGFGQLRLQKSYTPSSSTDTNGATGELAWDNDFIYIKTEQGWRRTKLESF